MKKFHIFLLLLALSPAHFAFAQNYGWVDISSNLDTEAHLSDVFFVSDSVGWITSSSQPGIFHTTDGGETFKMQTTQYDCEAIHMLNANEGYAGGDNGRVYRTTDGGKNWIAIGSIGTTLADISFAPSADTGYACGLNGNIWKISSSGVERMNSGVPDSFFSLSFPVNSSSGKVCGGSIIMTFTNGLWGGAPNSYPSGGYNDIFMVDDNIGWAVGTSGIIINTTDGVNFVEQTNPAFQPYYDVFFLDENVGYVVGDGGTIINTGNGGENWNIQASGITNNNLRAVYFTSPNNGYIVGFNGTLLKYTQITGIETNGQANVFELFPNPAAGKFKVQSGKFKVQEIEIYDLNGRKLFEKQITTGNETTEIDVSSLKSGMYFCKIRFKDECVTRKIIIQK